MLAAALFFLVAAAAKLEALEISCEKIGPYNSVKKCCFFKGTTVIDVANVKMGGLENGDVYGITFSGNDKIQFLPVNVYKKFPNLEIYSAVYAAVKKLSASNFEKLSSLEVLDLSDNDIESIPDDCFQGLLKLIKLNLRKYKKLNVYQ